MKMLKRISLAGAVLALAGVAGAQQAYPPPAGTPSDKPAASRDTTKVATSNPTLASKLIHKDIKNASGEKVGDLKDMVVEDDGSVVAIIKRSSDNELVGLPMASLTAQVDVKDVGKEQAGETPKVKEFLLKSGNEKLGSAPTINDVKNVDCTWVCRVKEHFGKAAARGEKNGADAEFPETSYPASTTANKPLCANDLIGKDLENTKGEDLGKVEDLAVNVNDGTIAYVVVSSGGMLGMGGTLHGVPLKALTVDASNKKAILSTDKDTIEKTPGIDMDHLPAYADLQVSATAHAGSEPVAQEPRR